MNGSVNALAIDASGNLYAGGSFTTAGGVTVNRIAKWNGSTWSALGSGMNTIVYALAFDSSGNLYAGGSFTTAGGVAVTALAKWNGTTWSAVGSLIETGDIPSVKALAFDSLGNLYAGGWFDKAGGIWALGIAKWNPSTSTWSDVGLGVNNSINALTFDSSGNLYAGGDFTQAGCSISGCSVTVKGIAKWNGTTWSDLGVSTPPVYALAFYGGNLYAGGGFGTTSGANKIAKYPMQTISGYVRNSSNSPISGVTMTLNTGDTDTTDAMGYYSLTVNSGWSGTVTPSKSDYTFTPANKSYSNVTSNQSNQNFTGTQNTRIINVNPTSIDFGKVRCGYPKQLTFTISNSGNSPLTVSSISYPAVFFSGDWNSGTIPAGGSQTITVTFNPQCCSGAGPCPSYSGTVTINSDKTSGTNTLSMSGESNAEVYLVSGYVRDPNNNGIPGVTLSFSDGNHSLTDASGYYSIAIHSWFNGTITPSKPDYIFTPPSLSCNGLTANLPNQNFTGVSRIINVSPTALDFGKVLGGMSRQLTFTIGNSGNSPLTVSSISYPAGGFSGDWNSGTIAAGGSQTVTVTFSPARGCITSSECESYSGTVTVNSDKTSGTNTLSVSGGANAQIYSFSGYVRDPNNNGIPGVTIAFSDGNTALTDNSGHYDKTIHSWFSGTVTPSKPDYIFTPPNRSYNGFTSNTDNQNFTGVSRIINITPTSLDFGKVRCGYSKQLAFTISNSGNSPLAVSSISYPSNVFSGDWNSGTIAAGASQTVTVTFVPKDSQCCENGWGDCENISYGGMVILNSDKTGGMNSLPISGALLSEYYKVSGYVRDSNNNGIPGATIKSSNGSSGLAEATTDSSGYYTLNISTWFNVTVTPSKSGYVFTPQNRAYGTISSNMDNQNFTGAVVSRIINVSPSTLDFGIVSFGGERVFTISNSGNSPLTVSSISYSDSHFSGNWSGTIPAGGSQTVTVTFGPVFCGFSPCRLYSGTVTVNSDKTSGTNTLSISGAGKPETTTVSGYVRDSDNNGIPGVTITFRGADNFGAITDNSGFYSLTIYSGSGTVTPSKSGYTFIPASRFYSKLESNQSDQNYTGALLSAPVMGDVNGSGGEPDLADAILSLQILAGLNLQNININADVNSDRKISLEEVVYILQKVAGLR
jgi:hypothetical protein